MTTEGMKFDQDKNRWDLFDFQFLDDVAYVLTLGAKKYAPNNWKLVEKWRYIAAGFRHFVAYCRGERVDSESGKSPLCHLCCCIMFLFGLDKLEAEKCQKP